MHRQRDSNADGIRTAEGLRAWVETYSGVRVRHIAVNRAMTQYNALRRMKTTFCWGRLLACAAM
jgi:hypothetical protein